MTFEQHSKFVKEGLKLYDEQISELEKIKREKEKLEEIKKEKIKERERLNHIRNAKKFKAIKKMKFLGNKRNLGESRNNYNMTKELICSIDEFIFHKRDVKLFNGYDSFFNNMKAKIIESKLNTNGLNVRKNILKYNLLQAILKLAKYMNNSRNFTNDISNKNSFISLKNEINKKIKDTLFDDNSLFLSSSFNYFCSNFKSVDLALEGKNISNILDNKSTINEEDIIEHNSISSGGKKAGEGFGIIGEAGIGGGSESLKKLSESEEEKSASFESKLSKISHIEENKQKYKYKICLLNYTDLFHLLDINKTDNNNKEKENDSTGNTNQKEINDMEKEALKQKIKELDDIIKNTNIDVKNNYLRRIVCLKLYKALIFSLKYFDLNKSDIKVICLYIELQGRIIDSTMSNKYKEFIDNIFKNISCCEEKNNI